MSRHVKTTIRYDGPALAEHEMDVQDLAPALLALADIIQIANRKFNSDAASIKVLVNADVEQKCFQIDLSLVQSLMDHAATLLGQKDVKTAEEIAKVIGIAVGASTSLFAFLKWLSGKDKRSGITFRAGDVTGTTIINIIGSENSIVIPNMTAALATDPEVIKRVKTVLQPLNKEGYSEVTFIDGMQEAIKIDKKEANDINSAPPLLAIEEPQQSMSRIRGFVRIKSAQYEGGAKWSLLWNGRAIDAEMSGQASDWVRGFQENRNPAPPGTVLDVSMTETVRVDSRGVITPGTKPSYVVTEVHSSAAPPTQISIDFGESDHGASA